MTTLKFGKHEGEELSEVPREYLEWLLDTTQKALREYQVELARRDVVEEAAKPVMERLISAGQKALARQAVGHDEMREIEAASEGLRALLKEPVGVGGF